MSKILFPILILIGAFFLGKYFLETGPEAKKRPFVERLPVVEIMPLKAKSYTVKIKASGTVTAGTKSNIVAEVSGRITQISDKLKEGNYFSRSDTLVQIDRSSYSTAVEIAKSEVEANRASLKQLEAEQKSSARSIQLAKKNLAIGNKELARVRALFKRRTVSRSAVDTEAQRVNQLQQTLQNLQGAQGTFSSRKNVIRARIQSSQARVKQENLKLQRTSIKAPYDGRVLKKHVDFGQFVPVGATLAESYATDFVNVELPLSLNQYELLGMPEAFRNKQISSSQFPNVTLTNPNSLNKDQWQGKVVRTGAALDEKSRQIKVIVRVDDPFEAKAGISTPLKIGQYLQAEINGKTFNNVFVLPPIAVIYNREVRLLKDGKIQIIPITVLWNSNDATVVMSETPIEGENLILTNLTQAVNGMRVITLEEQQKKNKRIRQRKKGNKNKTNPEKDKKGNKEKNTKKPEKQSSIITSPEIINTLVYRHKNNHLLSNLNG